MLERREERARRMSAEVREERVGVAVAVEVERRG